MEKILKDPIFNVPKQRIGAVDATKLDVDKHFTFPPNCIRASVKEYACLLSHLETIKFFSKSNYNTALIFEDDVDLYYKPYWVQSIDQVMQNAPSDWDILKLDIYHKYRNLYTKWKSICNPGCKPECTYNCDADWSAIAYIINKSGANKIMKMLHHKKYKLPYKLHVADFILFDEVNTYMYNILCLHPG